MPFTFLQSQIELRHPKSYRMHLGCCCESIRAPDMFVRATHNYFSQTSAGLTHIAYVSVMNSCGYSFGEVTIIYTPIIFQKVFFWIFSGLMDI